MIGPTARWRLAVLLLSYEAVVAPRSSADPPPAPTGGPPGASRGLADLRAEATRRARLVIERRVVTLEPIGAAATLANDAVARPSTGLAWDESGRILTSSYGLDPRPEAVLVTLAGGRRVSGSVVAVDRRRRIALVRMKPPAGYSLPPLSPWPNPRVGETAIAVGRTFRRDRTNLSVGVVSAVDRLGGLALQTDASASPANYGGPLIDLRGRVAGVITPLAPRGASETSGLGWYDSGIAFAVPLAEIEARVARLDRGEDIRRGRAGWSFLQGSLLATRPKLASVYPTGPAADAGLRPGDTLVAIGERRISTVREYHAATDRLDAGDPLTVTYRRGETERSATLTLVADLSPYQHPYLGVRLRRLRVARPGGAPAGVVVDAVFPGGPAQQAGLQPGDKLLSIDGEPIASRASLVSLLGGRSPGDRCEMKLQTGLDEGVETCAALLGVLEYTPHAVGPTACDAVAESLAVIGSRLPCRLFVPKTPGRRPTLIWLGGRIADQQGDALGNRLAEAGVMVAVPDESIASTPAAAQAYVKSLRLSLSARGDCDPLRLAIGGGGRRAAVALLLGLADSSPFAGVIVGRTPRPIPKIPRQTPASRTGVLLAPGGTLLLSKLSKAGRPVRRATEPAPQVLAKWLRDLDRL